MDFYSYLILSIVCLSPTLAECPSSCFCVKFRAASSVVLHVLCKDLIYVPRDHIEHDVTTLDLSSNKIAVLEDVSEKVRNMTQLKVLVLAKNNISIIEANALRGFSSLVTLDLSVNNITHIPSELFKTIPNLRVLSINYNPHLILPENGFSTNKLEHLQIGNSNLKDIPDKFFDTMPNIKFLNLEGNRIKHVDPHLSRSFESMTFVNLENNNLTVFQEDFLHLLSFKNVVLGLNGNPFPCDCPFKNGYEVYTTSHILTGSQLWFTESEQELSCEVPDDAEIREQEAYLNNITCSIKSNDDPLQTDDESVIDMTNATYNNFNESSDSSANSTEYDWDYDDYIAKYYDMHMWFTSHAVLWAVCGIVAFTVLCAAIVVFIKRATASPYPGTSRQFGLLQSEIEGGDEIDF